MNIYSCTIFESVCVASLRVVFFMFGMFATIGLLRHCYDHYYLLSEMFIQTGTDTFKTYNHWLTV